MMVSDEHRPLDCSPPHELTSNTPFSSLRLYFLIGILSLSALSIALLIYLCIRLSRTSKKCGTLAKETNSKASSGPSCEVFLSFRGPDTGLGFTDCLYHAMVEAGILVFRDDESLRVDEKIGDELLRAIENSKIYIPIFSKNYAASHWCLLELALMVDCTSKSNENKEILPIYLDVDPDDVKLKTKLYRGALPKHLKKFCTEAVESWKNALIEVGKIKGWNLKKYNGQGDLIHSVKRTVSAKLKVASEKVTDHLVGVDDRVQTILKMLDVGSDGVQFLKIHGMGGVGKTTLAKVIFNKLSSSFDRYCFIADVRESSKGNDGLVNLQKQLLSKLIGSHSIDQIYHVNDGINMMDRGVLQHKKVLIILDDVDKEEQLKSLAEKGHWFGYGSKIIITTRNNSVLTEGPNVSTYEAREMEFDHALKLFSRHAFNRDYPPDNRVSLSKQIVHTLGKLPLSLEIIGSSLKGKSKELWIETRWKLKKAPPLKVQQKLMISYEMLELAQREIFLDIACFFLNEDKIYPSYMWRACKYYPNIAIDVLVLMSLIKIKDDNTFWMHDQVRDLGREIVRQESDRSRVWKSWEAYSIMKRKEGSRKIEALSLGHYQDNLTHEEFANLRNLRFLEGNMISLVGDFDNLLSNLRWLSWRSCPKFEVTNFHPANLVVLVLSYSSISEEWIGWNQIKEARKLKVLDLSYCKYLKRTPDLSTWVCLERLVLKGCGNLIEIDHSIDKLELLTILNLDGCESLRELPQKIGCLQALTDFVMSPEKPKLRHIISKKPSLKLPYSIGGLVKLTRLNFSRCIYLEELPDSIGKLQSLVKLDLSSTNIGHLPDSIGKLQSLVELDLSSTNIGHLPDSIGNLKQLKVLRMINIRWITKLPSAIGLVEKLEELHAQGCCNLIGEIPKEIGRLCCLRILDLLDTRICGLPTTVRHLSNLQKLELETYSELKQFRKLPLSLTCLAWGCKKDWQYCSNKQLWHVKENWLARHVAHEEHERKGPPPPTMFVFPPQHVITLPTSIDSLSRLKSLRLCCKNVQFLPQLPSSLRELRLRDLATTRSPDFSNLKDLSILTFFGCSLEFSRIFDAESKELRIKVCEFRKVDAPLRLEMKRLRSLKMAHCKFLPEVLDLSRVKNLEKVSLKFCRPLVEIRGLEELGSLCSLSVVLCLSLERMSDLSKLKKLPKLRVLSCHKLNKQEIYWNYWNGEFGGDICNVGGFDLSSVPDERKVDAFFDLSRYCRSRLKP